MKRKIIILTIAVALVMSTGLLFAKSKPSSKGSQQRTTGSVKGETIQRQDQDRLRLQEKDALCYETKDGNLYEWKNIYNRRLQNYEKNGAEKRLHRYLREIANRYRLQSQSDVEGFVEWALKNRPWDI